MDGSRFDDLTRSIAGRSSRRDVVRSLLGAAIVAVAGGAGFRADRSRAEDGLATPELTVEPVAPTETMPEATLPPTNTAVIDPTVQPSATRPPSEPARATLTPALPRGSAGVTATPTLSLTPNAGKVGTSVTASVSGFPASSGVAIRLYTGAAFNAVGSFSTNASGGGSFTFLLPATTSGSHRMRAQGANARADAFFDVKRSTRLSPTKGPRGATVNVSLRGFKARKEHRILIYPSDTRTGTPVELKRVTTSSTGSASTTVTIPANAAFAKHRIEAIESGGTGYAGAFFTVPAPNLTPTPTPSPTATIEPCVIFGECTDTSECCTDFGFPLVCAETGLGKYCVIAS